MSVLSAYDLSMSFIERKLFDSITFTVEEKDKIGILNNSELFAIIDKQIAQSIVRAYKRSNT